MYCIYPVFLKKCLKRFLKAYGLCSIPSNIHKYFIRVLFPGNWRSRYGYHITAAKWARDNAMSYIGQVSWIYTWLHLIKNRRKWSDRLCFGQSMNMATTYLKQKTLIRKKEYMWNFILCTKTISLLTSILGGLSER